MGTTETLDRIRLTDERLVELTLAAVMTAVVVVAISWAIDGLYAASTTVGAAYLVAGASGLGLAIGIRIAHPVAFLVAILYFGAVVGDVLVAGSGFQEPLGVPGAIALFVLGTTALVLCRDAFFDRDSDRL